MVSHRSRISYPCQCFVDVHKKENFKFTTIFFNVIWFYDSPIFSYLSKHWHKHIYTHININVCMYVGKWCGVAQPERRAVRSHCIAHICLPSCRRYFCRRCGQGHPPRLGPPEQPATVCGTGQAGPALVYIRTYIHTYKRESKELYIYEVVDTTGKISIRERRTVRWVAERKSFDFLELYCSENTKSFTGCTRYIGTRHRYTHFRCSYTSLEA